MSQIKITELDELSSVDPTDFIEIVDSSDTTDGPGGTSKKTKIENISSGGIENFDPNSSYEIDDVVIYNDIIYQNTSAISGDGSPFDQSDWNELYTDRVVTSDVTVTGTNLGALESGDTISAGSTLQEVLDKLAAKELSISKELPSGSISLSIPLVQEVGTALSFSMNVSVNFGTLSQHEATNSGGQQLTSGSTAQDISVDLGESGATSTQIATSKTNATVSENFSFTIQDSNRTFVATLNWNDGEVPLTNLGNPDPSKQVSSGSTSLSSKTIVSKYKAWFGHDSSDPSTNSTVGDIISLPNTDDDFDDVNTLNFTANNKYIYCAISKGTSVNLQQSVLGSWNDVSTMPSTKDITYTKNSGNDGNDYTLYTWSVAGVFDGTFRIQIL